MCLSHICSTHVFITYMYPSHMFIFTYVHHIPVILKSVYHIHLVVFITYILFIICFHHMCSSLVFLIWLIKTCMLWTHACHEQMSVMNVICCSDPATFNLGPNTYDELMWWTHDLMDPVIWCQLVNWQLCTKTKSLWAKKWIYKLKN